MAGELQTDVAPKTASATFTEAYKAKAIERGIKPPEGGKWMSVDGIDYTDSGGQARKISDRDQKETFEERIGFVGTYNENNSTIALIDNEGRLRIGAGTQENDDALKKSGYKKGSNLFVPFSNGEWPIKAIQRIEYRKLRDEGRKKFEQETQERHSMDCKKIAESKGIKPINGGLWLDIDGMDIVDTEGERVKTVGSMIRLEQIGTYDSNSGKIVYVDHQGKLIIGPYTHENLKLLEDAGYKEGSMNVPFSTFEEAGLKDGRSNEMLKDIMEVGREKFTEENIQEHLLTFQKEADRKEIKKVEGGKWMNVDGVETTERTIGKSTGGGRLEKVGTYDQNSGVTAYVNNKGELIVGSYASANLDALKNAGYKKGSIGVPFSTLEKPKDPILEQQLRETLSYEGPLPKPQNPFDSQR